MCMLWIPSLDLVGCLLLGLSYIFTSDEEDLYFFTVANRGCFDNVGLNFFLKRYGMHRSWLTLRYGSTHVKESKWRHISTSLLSLRNANVHATSVRRQLRAAFLNCKFLFIRSLKWHYKPFSRLYRPYIIPTKHAEPSEINEKWLWKMF